MTSKIGIIGAGLSGLACAQELIAKGHEVTIFDKSSEVGGRVKTDVVDGFLLDHGFQVYLPSYPTGKKLFNYKSLELKSFGVGAWLKSGTEVFSCFSDPIRNPMSFFKVLSSDKALLKDKILMLKLKISALSEMKKEKARERSCLEFLKDYGFSDLVIESFFRPFFAGVFLEEDLNTSSHYFLYLFDKFSKSRASVPASGMADLVKDLMFKMPDVKIKLNTEVSSYDDKAILAGAETFEFDRVVVAGALLNVGSEIKFNSVTTYYFKTQSRKFKSKYLYLCNKDKKDVNHVACMTAVSEDYAPKGWELFSVNIIGESTLSEGDVLLDLEDWFGKAELSCWSFLKKYTLKKALPVDTSFGKQERKRNGVYFCGDYMESPSIEGALSSGVKLAQMILKEG